MSDTIEKWDYFELTLSAAASGNPFRDVSLEAEFVHDHRSITVKGFYDGDDTYRLRFMPDMEGDWNYVTHSSLAALDGQTGEFLCTPPAGNNHGPVRVVDPYHFAYARTVRPIIRWVRPAMSGIFRAMHWRNRR